MYDPQQLQEQVLGSVVRPFYSKLSDSISKTSADTLIKRKNPYLVGLRLDKQIKSVSKTLLDAHISSSEETLLGNLLEELAISINRDIYGGTKAQEGKFGSIDLIFDNEEVKYLVSIKSGINWGNADQKRAMKTNFSSAQSILRDEGWAGKTICINGCIYGKASTQLFQDELYPNSDYYRIVGANFWSFISGDPTMHHKVLDAVDKASIEFLSSPDNVYTKVYDKKLKEIEEDLLNKYGSDKNQNQVGIEKLLGDQTGNVELN